MYKMDIFDKNQDKIFYGDTDSVYVMNTIVNQ